MTQASLQIDPKELLTASISQAGETFSKDLAYIPEDKWNTSPMGCARSPQAFTAECAGFNSLCASVLRGEPMSMPSQEEIEAMTARLDSVQKGQAAIKGSTDSLVAAIRECAPEKMFEEVTAPWGQPMTVFKLVNLCAHHMSYHDGQLNYIQCLYGDSAFHWMEH